MKLLPTIVMTFSDARECPWCEDATEWHCLDDGEFVWRLMCLGCGAEVEDAENGALL